MKLPPTRRWLLGRLASGQGPTPQQRAKSWFRVRFVGTGGGRGWSPRWPAAIPATTRRRRCSPSRRSAWRFDELPPTAGQVTPVAAMGDALLDRLVRAGMTFRVLGAGLTAAVAVGGLTLDQVEATGSWAWRATCTASASWPGPAA